MDAHHTAPVTPAVAQRIASALALCEARLERDPAVLDWGSGLNLARAFPSATVFSPPTESRTLPYLDRSIDIVVCPPGRHAVAEGRRVASTMLVVVGDVVQISWIRKSRSPLRSGSRR